MYVDVYQTQTDLFQLAFHVEADGVEKFVTVGVDFLNVHCGDNQTQLTEYDVLCKLLNCGQFETSQSFRRVLHNARFCGYAHGENRGDVNTYILLGQRVFEVHAYGNGGEVHVAEILEKRPHQARAAVHTQRGTLFSVLCFPQARAEYNHDFVRRTFFVARCQSDEYDKQNNDCRNHRHDYANGCSSVGKK